MSQDNSGSTFSSDSDILYSLNINQDLSEDDAGDSLDSDTDEINNIHDKMEIDSEVDNDSDNSIVDTDEIDVNMVSTDHKNISWSRTTNFEPNLPPFEGRFMLKDSILLPKYPSPFDFFNLFFTQEIVDHIVQQSNLYHTQQNFKQAPMTNQDLYRLIGFLFYSSLYKLPRKSDYWSTSFGPDIVMKNITRDRIFQLLRSLHFGDNNLQTQSCDKIEPLIHLFNKQCDSVIRQEQNISIDEQIIRFKGKTAPKNYKQYMPKKPIRRGFKLWCLSGVSAFTYKVKLYRGASGSTPVAPVNLSRRTTTSFAPETRSKHQTDEENEKLDQQYDDIKHYGRSGMIVIDLLEGVPKGSHVFVDNYFGSLTLLNKMSILGYGLTCTLRSSRIKNCPVESEKNMKKKPRGYYDYLVSADKKNIIVAWKDNRRVLIGSNSVGVEPITQLSRWSKEENKKIPIDTPQIIQIYNKNRGGVDKMNMLCSLHPIPFKSKKWYMPIAWRLIDMMVINSWIIWKYMSNTDDQNSRSTRLFYFKMAIANTMLRESRSIERRILQSSTTTHYQSSTTTHYQSSTTTHYQSSESDDDENILNPPKRKKKETRSSVSSMVRLDGIEHWPEVQRNIRLRCKNDRCSMKSNIYCTKCQVHLCLNVTRNCFKDYHSKK
ncbi:unnamed protein product [Rotaria sordida]|uniref:PiggyBac transposable element-derived protein domain-containing protein n=1 Tax=Rotaria sordida TaxID=392033 RepID=A0A819WS07_9BILA|nr:unnamed protein product [Rotaria sordida]CAF4129394.1 unnamed protein product [Rotaria sordida]